MNILHTVMKFAKEMATVTSRWCHHIEVRQRNY